MSRTLVLVAATCVGLSLSAAASHPSGAPAPSKTCGDCHHASGEGPRMIIGSMPPSDV